MKAPYMTVDFDRTGLRIKNLIAQQEIIIATAHEDTRRGGWNRDYESQALELQREIDALFDDEDEAQPDVPVSETRYQLRDMILRLRNEIACRIEHGAESGGHLDYVKGKLDGILEVTGED